MYYPLMPKSSWTFLSNHGHLLIYISQNPEARVREIATNVGITERRALAILGELEESGYISVERIGRRNHYTVNPKGRFRHPLEANRPIKALLKIFS